MYVEASRDIVSAKVRVDVFVSSAKLESDGVEIRFDVDVGRADLETIRKS